jgi:hypothetical protein
MYSFSPFKRSLYSPVGKGWISSTAEMFTISDLYGTTPVGGKGNGVVFQVIP